MININWVKWYCKDYEKIENYQEAISSPGTYVCHHRKEIDEGLSRKDLIKLGLCYNRPPEELIFLSVSEHSRLHNIGNNHHSGHNLSKGSKNKISKANKGKLLGSKNPNYRHICPALLKMMYINQGKTVNKISKELGIYYKTTDKHLKELNIKKENL